MQRATADDRVDLPAGQLCTQLHLSPAAETGNHDGEREEATVSHR